MSAPIPYGIRALALSHARAWPTALWTGGVTAIAAGLVLSPSEWAVLAGLTALCGTAVRTITAQVVQTWLEAHPSALDAPHAPTSDFDTATHHALSLLA